MPCKSNQSCCNNDCNQGRDCPNRKSVELWKIWHNFLYSTNFTLMEWFVMFIAGATIAYEIIK
jgi:hypothetical protein